MARMLLCKNCDKNFTLDPVDSEMGWQMRRFKITVQKPEVHQVKITADNKTDTINLPSLLCDYCNTELANGTDAVAVTMWQNTEPPQWEQEYGTNPETKSMER